MSQPLDFRHHSQNLQFEIYNLKFENWRRSEVGDSGPGQNDDIEPLKKPDQSRVLKKVSPGSEFRHQLLYFYGSTSAPHFGGGLVDRDSTDYVFY